MAIIFTVQGIISLFGKINTDLVKEKYLQPNGFSATEETRVYPSGLYLIGRKELIMKNKKKNKEYSSSLEFIFSKNGFLNVFTSIEITVDDYTSIDSELFSIEDYNFVFTDATIFEITWKLLEHIYGKSSIDLQLSHDLQTPYFKEYCEKYGIVPVGEIVSTMIGDIVTISTLEDFEKIKNLERHKSKGGSISSNKVYIPNFDNTAVSLDPDIHILNSSNFVIYTNDFLIKDTFNLVTGILFQTFGLNYSRIVLKFLQNNLREIRKYYKSSDNNHISWIYIDRALTKEENRYEELISSFEPEFLEFDEPDYVNLKNVTFKEDLNFILNYTSAERKYVKTRNYTKKRLSSFRSLVSDKGEKEEKQAYNRIVAIIGLLAIFQIVPSVLPLFNQPLSLFNQNIPLSNLIRIVFLIIFFPSLVVIWYVTSYNNRRKIKEAEKIEHKTNLIKEKDLLLTALVELKNLTDNQPFQISKETLKSQLAIIEEKLNEVEQEVKKLDKR